jgi:hypothetical protein
VCAETEINKQLSIPASEDFGQKKMEIRQKQDVAAYRPAFFMTVRREIVFHGMCRDVSDFWFSEFPS